MVRYTAAYENSPLVVGRGRITGGSADLAFALLFGGIVMCFVGHFMGQPFMAKPLLEYIIYLWSRKNPDAPISIYGFRFKGINLPWVFLAISILLGSPVWNILCGIGVGHLFFFLNNILPNTHGTELFGMPNFLLDFFENDGVTTAYSASGRQGQYRGAAGHQWGGGRALGGN